MQKRKQPYNFAYYEAKLHRQHIAWKAVVITHRGARHTSLLCCRGCHDDTLLHQFLTQPVHPLH